MINRIAEYADQQGKPVLAGAKQAWEAGNRNLKRALTQLEETVVQNPGAALATAFVVGLAVAWWLKRR